MDLQSSLENLKQRIRAACEAAGRDPASVELIAVSKKQSAQAISELANLGQVLFGESRVQEAKVKIPRCPGNLRWHMIGHLQTNKCRDAVYFFEMIQSVDSMKLAEEINKWADRAAKSMPVLLEVNVAAESSKHGYAPEAVLAELDDLNAFSHLEIHGLMTVAPFCLEPEKARPYFAKLRELKTACEDRLGAPLPQLSMGMSNDFEIAIEEGATMVRIGTGLFGARSTKDDD